MLRHNFWKVRSRGWRPSRIASTMSGARKAQLRTLPTYRSVKPARFASEGWSKHSPFSTLSYQPRARATAFISAEFGRAATRLSEVGGTTRWGGLPGELHH